MARTRTMPIPRGNEIRWIETFYFCDVHGREIEFDLSMVESKTKVFITLDFSIYCEFIPTPDGITVTNNLQDSTPFKAMFTDAGAGILAIPLDEGFRILYMGRDLVSALPNIKYTEELMQHQVVRSS